MRSFTAGLLGLFLVCGIGGEASGAVIASSTFDTDAEGWRYWNGARPIQDNLLPPIYLPAGGNPDGHIRIEDAAAPNFFFVAPDAYLGDQSGAIGGSLAWDQLAGGGTQNPAGALEDVILIGGGLTLYFDLQDIPGPAFSRRVVDLTASAGWLRQAVPGPNDPSATDAEFATVMGSLDAILINGEFRFGPDFSALDNVALVATAPPAGLLGLTGLAWVLLAGRRHRHGSR